MNDYISKPVDPEELMAAIRRNLAGPPPPAA
jgi:DNA-binding response OmpR family regulator